MLYVRSLYPGKWEIHPVEYTFVKSLQWKWEFMFGDQEL